MFSVQCASQKPWRCYKLAQSLGLLLPTIISNYPLIRPSNYSSDNKRSQSGARVAIAVQARYNLLQLPCNLAHIFGRPSYDFAIHLLVFASPDSTGESRNWFCTAPRRSSNLASLQASSRAPGSFLFTTTVLPPRPPSSSPSSDTDQVLANRRNLVPHWLYAQAVRVFLR